MIQSRQSFLRLSCVGLTVGHFAIPLLDIFDRFDTHITHYETVLSTLTVLYNT